LTFTILILRYDTYTLPPAAYAPSNGVQTHQTHREAPQLAREPSQRPMSSRIEPQANANPPTIPIHARSEPVTNGPRTQRANNQTIQVRDSAPVNGTLEIPIPPLAPNEDEPNVGCVPHSTSVQSFPQYFSSIPGWITLIKPRPSEGETRIQVRRETHIALEIIFGQLPKELPAGCNGIKILPTGSVKNYADTNGKTLLEFRIRVYGATTKQLYETVCTSCQDREGKKKGTPSLIDFCAKQDIIEPKDGKVRVEFQFCCYAKDHRSGDTDYL
jgi:hypothetical protein